MVRKLSISFVTVALAACVAEARPRHGNPAAGQVLNGIFQGLSQAQRDTERRARQEEARRLQQQEQQRRENERAAQRQQRELDRQAVERERQRQLEFQRRQVEIERERADAARKRQQAEDDAGIGGISLNRWQVYLAAAGVLIAFLAFIKR